jgi:hypothetical protein
LPPSIYLENSLGTHLLVDHVGDEFDAGCAANLVVAFEATFEVENKTFEQQLANIGKLEEQH